jgi:hypothetical protein
MPVRACWLQVIHFSLRSTSAALRLIASASCSLTLVEDGVDYLIDAIFISVLNIAFDNIDDCTGFVCRRRCGWTGVSYAHGLFPRSSVWFGEKDIAESSINLNWKLQLTALDGYMASFADLGSCVVATDGHIPLGIRRMNGFMAIEVRTSIFPPDWPTFTQRDFRNLHPGPGSLELHLVFGVIGCSDSPPCAHQFTNQCLALVFGKSGVGTAP